MPELQLADKTGQVQHMLAASRESGRGVYPEGDGGGRVCSFLRTAAPMDSRNGSSIQRAALIRLRATPAMQHTWGGRDEYRSSI